MTSRGRAARVNRTLPAMALAAAGTAVTDWLGIADRKLSIDAAITGTPTGVFSLECSFDSGATVKPVPGASAVFTANGQAQPAGGASSPTWVFLDIPGGVWRLKYTATSGTGSAAFKFAWGP